MAGRYTKDWSIQSKLLAVLLTVGLGSTLLISFLAWERFRSNLQGTVRDYLTSIRTSNANQIERFFQGLRNHIKTLAEDRMVVEAMVEFNRYYDELNSEYIPPEWGVATEGYYQENFFPRLSEAISGELNYGNFAPESQAAQYLQYHYIAANPNPVGEKDKLAMAEDGSRYSLTHQRYHEIFQNLIQTYGYYDLFLIDYRTGDIVYSVYKETDYATSLDQGPYNQSGLAQIVQKVRQNPEREVVQIVDFGTYRPSYGAPAAFLGAPIYNGPHVVGILALQLPVDEINRVLNKGGNYGTTGLGETGEIYLVGSDSLMRSDSRRLIEDAEAYRSALPESGTPPENRRLIDLFETSILLQRADTGTTRSAIEGNAGTAVTENYLGEQVLSSYAPLNLEGLNWAILSEIKLSEAYRPVGAVQLYLLIVTAIIAAFITWLSSFVAASFVRPVNKLVKGMDQLAEGDTDIEVKQNSQDEFGQMAADFNQTVVRVRQLSEALAQKEKENEALLLNILPAPVVERLKTDEAQVADSIKLATIMFARVSGLSLIKGDRFKKVAQLLSELISAFDRAAVKNQVGKVKTNGDLYIAACGVLRPRLDSTKLMMAFAVEMFSILRRFNKQHREELLSLIGRELTLSIGIDDGPVLAGIVGTDKFSYDVWGETVSVADFLQMHADPEHSEILVTPEVYERLQDDYKFEEGEDLHFTEINQTLGTWVLRRPIADLTDDPSIEVGAQQQ